MAILGILFSKKSIAAAAMTTSASVVSAWFLGFDIFPWLIGAIGASLIQVFKPAETRIKALAGSVISVFIGGVISPAVAHSAWIERNFLDGNNNTYALSLFFAATWPWVLPLMFISFQELIEKIINKISGYKE